VAKKFAIGGTGLRAGRDRIWKRQSVLQRELQRRHRALCTEPRHPEQLSEIIDHRKDREGEQVLLSGVLDSVAHQRLAISVQIDQQALDLRRLQGAAGSGLEGCDHVGQDQVGVQPVGVIDKRRRRQIRYSGSHLASLRD
jgi:hypothetical protein